MSELRDELKDRYRSTFTVENMLGGMVEPGVTKFFGHGHVTVTTACS
jgi:hypothetical protein